MVGMRWASPTLLLVALLALADGTLRGRVQQTCSNSDGLSGYSFSHKGLWIPGYNLLGTGFTKQGCAVECSKHKECVAFSGAFENGENGGCYTYAQTGKNVPSSGDRAYKKCKDVSPDKIPGAMAMHATAAETLVGNEAALVAMAEGMEKQLDAVSKTISDADVRMRRLKSMVAGAANVLTGSARVASVTGETALGNRAGLQAIARSKGVITMSFEDITRSSVGIDKILKKMKARKGKPAKVAVAATGPSLAALVPNVTAIEKKMNILNDPKTAAEIADLEGNYKNFTGGIRSTVKGVVRTHLRGLVDTMREGYHNLTTAFQAEKKDPCCCQHSVL